MRYLLILLNLRRVARVLWSLEQYIALDGKPSNRHKQWDGVLRDLSGVPQSARDGRRP